MKKEFMTFRIIGNYEINDLKQDTPSCFNGMVRYKQTKITIEEIKEDKKILAKRLQKLWDKNENMHYYEPLKKEAKRLKYSLSKREFEL